MSVISGVNALTASYQFNLEYARQLVVDLETAQMYQSFGDGLENHPGFTLGHLCVAAGLTVEYLGGNYDVASGWDEYFRRTGPGDPRRPAMYHSGLPSKEMLLSELTRLHGEVEQCLVELPEDEWSKPAQWRLCKYYPTKRDLVTFMCITHEAMHLGQVAAWRRAAGLESALAQL